MAEGQDSHFLTSIDMHFCDSSNRIMHSWTWRVNFSWLISSAWKKREERGEKKKQATIGSNSSISNNSDNVDDNSINNSGNADTNISSLEQTREYLEHLPADDLVGLREVPEHHPAIAVVARVDGVQHVQDLGGGGGTTQSLSDK